MYSTLQLESRVVRVWNQKGGTYCTVFFIPAQPSQGLHSLEDKDVSRRQCIKELYKNMCD